jgi:beta-RFAP synthase
MIRVVAPSRLHFGLVHVPPAGACPAGERAFGGVGLMIDAPGVGVRVRPADAWCFEGVPADRARAFAERFRQSHPDSSLSPQELTVERCPPEHTGLGVGTQLALAVAKGLAVAAGEGEVDSRTLAERVGRGERSAIGVHGFDRGGLIVDGGKVPGEPVAPLVAHVALPPMWRVVLLTPPAPADWHGTRERMAFAEAQPGDPEALRALAHTAILPAARAADLDAFAEAVHEFNRRAGEPFAAVQGGPYASPAVTELVADLRAAGVKGVGQSSWGPTVFAVVGDSDIAMSVVLRFGRRVPVTVARVSEGHTVHRD